jgi:adenylate kinase
MSNYDKIILLGAPGAGKGTQAETLSEHLGLEHIASGELFRKEIDKNSPLGKESKYYIENGLLVPDKLTNEIIIKGLNDNISNGFILDGFPRNLKQVYALESIIDISLETGFIVFFIKVEKELAIKRLTLRSVVQNRLDDKHDSVLKRIEVYEQKTKPVIEYFKNKKVLFEINGASSMKIVSKDILNIISDKMMLLKSEGS